MRTESRERRALVEEFSARGLRLTSQRRVLLEIIQSSDEHLDAASLLRLASERDTSIDRATVYRTLELLKKLRLVDELDLMHLNGEKHYYEAKRARDHIHLACFQCGKIEEFGSPSFESLKQEIARERGFHIDVVRMEVGGRCSSCAQRTA
jgi:Fur family ferric uptake transcriptional regulator